MSVMARPRFVADMAVTETTTILAGPEGGILLGMPQLSGVGLSENWLLKELGHRHWMALAKAAGMEAPGFRDDFGEPVYAAFCAVRIEGAQFALARENGRLSITTSLSRVSRTQVLSRHEVVIDGLPAGAVEMVSAFVRRTGSSNHSIARVSIGGLMPIETRGSELAGVAASLRARRLRQHLGFDLTNDMDESVSYLFEPCPAQDFNGAGFLYFTSFISFVDRAEWQHDRRLPSPMHSREAYYYGNVDAGEGLRVVLVAKHASSRWWQIRRDDTGAVLADVFTQRASGGTCTTRSERA